MSLKKLGEFGWIERLRKKVVSGPGVLVGIGDDAAVLSYPVRAYGRTPLQLMTTDMLIEGKHFRLSEATPEEIGWKAMAVNLSDIAAMGGRPTVAVVAVGLPTSYNLKKADALSRGVRRAAKKFGVKIVGGDTNSSDKLVIAITLLGEVSRNNLVLRSGAKVGDAVWVTGWLGGSYQSGRHLRFTPRVREANWLVDHFKIHAMMDLSDGLSSDIFRMAKESRVGFKIEAEKIPVSQDAKGIQAALSDGEDFELLFTLSPSDSKKLEKISKKQIQMTCVGTVTNQKTGIVLVDQHGHQKKLLEKGFNHFSRPNA